MKIEREDVQRHKRVYSHLNNRGNNFNLMIAANKWEHYLGMYGDSLLVRVEDSTFEISNRLFSKIRFNTTQNTIQYNTP